MRTRWVVAVLLCSRAALAWPPGFQPRDANGLLVGPAVVEALHRDWAERARDAARAQGPRLAEAVDAVMMQANEISTGSPSRKAFRDALGALVHRPPETWLALGGRADLDGPDAASIELMRTDGTPGLVEALVDPKTGRAIAIVLVPLEPLPWKLEVSMGHSIEGYTYDFKIARDGRLAFQRITPTTWKPDQSRDLVLRPAQRARLVELVDRQKLAKLESQDTKKHPFLMDAGKYYFDLDQDGRVTHAVIGMNAGPGSAQLEPERRLAPLLQLLGSIVQVEVR